MKLPRNVSGAALQASLRRLGYDTDRRGDACVAPTTSVRTEWFNGDHHRVRHGGVAKHGATVNVGTSLTVGATHASPLPRPSGPNGSTVTITGSDTAVSPNTGQP